MEVSEPAFEGAALLGGETMRYRFFLVIGLLLVAGPAFAQDAATAEPVWLNMVLGAMAALIPAFLSTFVKSEGWIMKVIDAFAFNWGKARNDPGSQ